jgi:hypothetical protein
MVACILVTDEDKGKATRQFMQEMNSRIKSDPRLLA